MSSHTPGPWAWMDTSLWGAETAATHDGKTCTECGHSPADCGPAILGIACEALCNDGEDWAPSEADRRLIASAPDLLDALRDVVDFMTGCVEGETAALHNALSAIAKATGEPS